MMNWASKFRFLKPLTIDLNTDEAMVIAQTDIMVIEVMVIVVVVDMVDLNTDEAMVIAQTDLMVIEVMVIVVVVDMVDTSIGGVKLITIISGDCSFACLLQLN